MSVYLVPFLDDILTFGMAKGRGWEGRSQVRPSQQHDAIFYKRSVITVMGSIYFSGRAIRRRPKERERERDFHRWLLMEMVCICVCEDVGGSGEEKDGLQFKTLTQRERDEFCFMFIDMIESEGPSFPLWPPLLKGAGQGRERAKK